MSSKPVSIYFIGTLRKLSELGWTNTAHNNAMHVTVSFMVSAQSGNRPLERAHVTYEA